MPRILAVCAAVALATVPIRAAGQSSPGTAASDPAMLALAVALARTPPPAVPRSADEAGMVELAGTVAADALVFATVPTLRASTGADSPQVWWIAEAVNLPQAIEAGVPYRDVVIRFTLAGRIDDIWAMLLDAGDAARGIRIYGPARTYAPAAAPTPEPYRAMPVAEIPRSPEGRRTLRIAAEPAFVPPTAAYAPAPIASQPAPIASQPAPIAYQPPPAYQAAKIAYVPAVPSPVASITVTVSFASAGTPSAAPPQPPRSAPADALAAAPAGVSPQMSVVAVPPAPASAPASAPADAPPATPPLPAQSWPSPAPPAEQAPTSVAPPSGQAPTSVAPPAEQAPTSVAPPSGQAPTSLAPPPAPGADAGPSAEPPPRPGVTPLSMPDPWDTRW